MIDGYGDGGFRLGGERFHGSILVLGDRVEPWPVSEPGAATAASLAAVAGAAILVAGCGSAFTAEPAGLRESLRAGGTVLEWMDTGAACRTFNVLVLEGRDVAAALIAV